MDQWPGKDPLARDAEEHDQDNPLKYSNITHRHTKSLKTKVALLLVYHSSEIIRCLKYFVDSTEP